MTPKLKVEQLKKMLGTVVASYVRSRGPAEAAEALYAMADALIGEACDRGLLPPLKVQNGRLLAPPKRDLSVVLAVCTSLAPILLVLGGATVGSWLRV